MQSAAQSSRTHLVFVPGFGGFDVLGEIEYYAGTTGALRQWIEKRKATSVHPLPVLHYFDNFPTAGVKTRAALLREFLAKRLARNDIQPDDRVVLIGHSTGGLDIRQLLCDLTGKCRLETDANRPLRTAVDGDEQAAVRPTNDQLRRLIRKVVFLSVPHHGTNIADWLRKYGDARRIFLFLFRSVVDAADIPGVERMDTWWANHVTEWMQRDAEHQWGLRVALADVHLEIGQRKDEQPLRSAKGRTAHADVNLWLSHTSADFLAIDDLASDDELGPDTPARFTAEQRRQEMEGWAQNYERNWGAIRVRSYATLGRCPFHDEWLRERNVRASHRISWPVGGIGAVKKIPESLEAIFKIAREAEDVRGKSDLPYRFVYLLCSKGPFEAAPEASAAVFGNGGRVPLESWHNDGIVNTASMLWPAGETFLVHADHGDIIGHYDLGQVADRVGGRKYARYDILESSSTRDGKPFDDGTFRDVWHDIFDFAARDD